jgi:hypothetical protein
VSETAAQFLRGSEAVEIPPPRPRIGVEAMAGRWLKTDDKPQWIGSLDVSVDGDDLLVRVFGGGAGPSPSDWGTVRTEAVYAGSLSSGDALAGAFVAFYELPGISVELQANLNLGLLVVATYVTFRQAGPLADRFTREFFRSAAEGEEASA